MKLFVCIFDDACLLPQFLRHYSDAGIRQFHVAAPSHLSDLVASASRSYDVVQYGDLNVEDSFVGGVSAVAEMRRRAQAAEEWVVIADLDEFIEFDVSPAAIGGELEREGANVARGVMYDRFALDGQPKPVDGSSQLASLFPVRARFTRDVMRGTEFKAVMVKGHLKSRGAHHVFHDERVSERPYLEISHYKWIEGALERVGLAYEANLAAGSDWTHEFKAILDHYETHGRFAWETFGGELVGPAPRE